MLVDLILPIILFFITIHVYKYIIYDFYSEESIKKETLKEQNSRYGNYYC